MKTRWVAIILILLYVPLSAQPVQDTIHIGGLYGADPWQQPENAPVLLALSGGGARGLASIGVLKAFEEKGISVAAIAGTSIGGIVGGLYACGYSADELISIIRSVDFSTLFANKPARSSMFVTQRQERDRHLLSVRFDGVKPYIPQGLTAGQRLTSLLTSLTAKATYHAYGDFTRLPIPFKTITTDIVSGKMEIISHGSLADAMRATMAFPLAFTGLDRDSQILMDGGMVAPIPVQQVKQMCDTAGFVVAVNTTSPLLPKNRLASPVDIANQVTTIMTADQLTEQLRSADYVITPSLDEFSSSDFAYKDSIMQIGYHDGLRVADDVLRQVHQRADTASFHFSSVTVETASGALADSLRALFTGRVITRRALIADLKRLVREFQLFQLDAICEPALLAGDSGTPGSPRYRLRLFPRRNLVAAQTTFEIIGNSVFSDSLLVARMELTDNAITAPELQAGLDRIVNQYHVNGWDLADIQTVDIGFDSHTVRIRIDEGIVRRIDVVNNVRTRDWLIRAYCPLRVGEPYSTKDASAGLTNIYATDLFERVSIIPEAKGDGAIVKITVEEKKYLQARLGWHWDDEYQSEEFLELLNDNLFGIGMEYLLHVQYGNQRQHYAAELKANRIFKTYMTGQAIFFHDRLDRPLFDASQNENGIREENSTGGSFKVGQQIARFGTVTGGIIAKEVQLEDHRARTESRYGVRTVSLESMVENFDRWPFPRTGKKHVLELSAAGKFLGGDIEYTRFFSSLESYFPLGSRMSYHPRLSLGISRSGLPPTEQFYMGGMHSFSGLRTNQLAGDKTILLNQELRFKMPVRSYLTAQYDIGEVYTSADQIKLKNLRHGFGLSLAFDLLIGPIEFGYGVADKNVDRFYFNAGLTF